MAWTQQLWSQVCEQGWCGTAIPEEYGGLGIGRIELCALAEELGRALAPVPFASSIYAFAEGLLLAGSEAQKRALLPLVASGEVIGALAFSEGPGVLTPERIETRVARGRMTGVKTPVIDGVAAHRALVLAKDADGRAGLYVVDLTGEGVAREIAENAGSDAGRGEGRVFRRAGGVARRSRCGIADSRPDI